MKKVIFFITLLVIVLAVSIYPPQESKASVNLRLIKNSTSKNIYTDSLKIKSDSVQILVKELLHQDTILENINSELKKIIRFMDLETQKKLQQLGRKICSLKEVYSSNTALSGLVEGCYKLGVNTTTGDFYYKDGSGNWAIPNTGGGGTPTEFYFEITKAQLDTAIVNNTLVKGELYKISTVHPTLYNDGVTAGVSVFLKALATNKLESFGTGIFYNPKYNTALNDFGIWNNVSRSTCTVPTGVFRPGELITANNGATATLISGFANGEIYYNIISGDWSTATSITNPTSATATVSAHVLRTYAIGAKVYYGGYVWQNLTGVVGTAPTIFTLDATNWVKIVYNTTDYNLVYDEIEYDYTNNIITKRKDSLNNTVEYQFADIAYFLTQTVTGTPINVFQWGNKFIQRNYVYSGYLDCLNTMGEVMGNDVQGQSIFANNFLFTKIPIVEQANVLLYFNILKTKSNLRGNVLIQNSLIDGNTLDRSSITNNKLYYTGRINASILKENSTITGNEIRRASWSGNILEQSCTINNNLSNQNAAAIAANKMMRGSAINSNTLNGLYTQFNGSDRAFIGNNTMWYSTINSNILNVVFAGGTIQLSSNDLIGDINADIAIRTSAINFCTITGNGHTYIRMCELRVAQIINAVINSSANDFKNIKLRDYVWNFGNVVTLGGKINNLTADANNINLYFQKIFDGGAGNGLLGGVVIPNFEAPIGYFIEQVIVEIITPLVSASVDTALTLGLQIDGIESGLNTTTGNIINLNNQIITKILLSNFIKASVTQKIVLNVFDTDITSGVIGVNVKLTKL